MQLAITWSATPLEGRSGESGSRPEKVLVGSLLRIISATQNGASATDLSFFLRCLLIGDKTEGIVPLLLSFLFAAIWSQRRSIGKDAPSSECDRLCLLSFPSAAFTPSLALQAE
jgi:hypothetical protein